MPTKRQQVEKALKEGDTRAQKVPDATQTFHG
jgi:hypothetical protein